MDPDTTALFPTYPDCTAPEVRSTVPLARWRAEICPLPMAPEPRPPEEMWTVPREPLETLPEVTAALPRWPDRAAPDPKCMPIREPLATLPDVTAALPTIPETTDPEDSPIRPLAK
jgi:hypothetical protein